MNRCLMNDDPAEESLELKAGVWDASDDPCVEALAVVFAAFLQRYVRETFRFTRI
jgi:hypothetical protein